MGLIANHKEENESLQDHISSSKTIKDISSRATNTNVFDTASPLFFYSIHHKIRKPKLKTKSNKCISLHNLGSLKGKINISMEEDK